MNASIAQLVARLTSAQKRILSVVACEVALTVSDLDRLHPRAELRQWILESLDAGLFIEAGVLHGLPHTRHLAGERAIAVSPEVRSLVLRSMANSQSLEETRSDCRTVMGARSLSGFTTALVAGSLPLVVSEVSELMRRSSRGEAASLVRARLRESVCTPFDAEFLWNTWGDSAWVLIEQVMLDARVALDRIDPLYAWVTARLDEAMTPRLMRLVAEHAFLRHDATVLSRLIPRLTLPEQLPLRAAHCVLQGTLAQAQDCVSELMGSRSQQSVASAWPTSMTVLLMLLALRRELVEAQPLVKRLRQLLTRSEVPAIAAWPTVPLKAPISRAIRGLLGRLTQPDSERLRMSPHHHPGDAAAWETLILALTVELEDCDAVTRLSWTRRLQTDALRWQANGYDWMARQATQLGKAICPEDAADCASLADYRSGEVMLAGSLEREPDWRRALRALERFAENAERGAAIVARRVAWFVDMSCAELAKPALEEYRTGDGWKRGSRVDFDEVRNVKEALPPEDVAVLDALDAAPKQRHLATVGIAALCGHPRVFNGARGRQPVEVVRGHCRIETREDRGHLLIHIVPAGAMEGDNVVIEGDARLVVYRVDATLARLIQLLPHGIRIPNARSSEGLAVLARLADHVDIRSPELGAMRIVTADPNPCIRISPDAGAFWVEVGVRPFGEFGRFFPPGLGRTSVAVHSDDDLFDSERNLDEELVRFHRLLAQSPTLNHALEREAAEGKIADSVTFSASFGEEELYALLMELRGLDAPCALEWQNCRAIVPRGLVGAANIQGALRRVKGWYLVNGRVNVESLSALTLGDLIRMPFTRTGRFIRLPTGDFFEVERRIQQVLSRLRNMAQLTSRGVAAELRLPESAVDLLHELRDVETSLEVDADAAASLDRIDRTLATVPEVPDTLAATLRPYQVDGFRWLWRYSQLEFGVCLADDMGLGKTLQVIALLLTRSTGGPALVVAPTSVCSNWLEELCRFAPTLLALEYVGKSRASTLERFKPQNQGRTADVLIASYAMLQQDAAELASLEWNTAVLDEAQFIKNPHSLRAKAAFHISARYRVAMTGTPVENHLGDLWSIFHFLNPNLLGSFKHFQLCYLKPIERDHDNAQQIMLKKLLQPFLLRRRKDEVLCDLPPITTLRHEVRLSDEESLRYALLRRQIHDKLYTSHGKRDHKLQVLAEITRLRRFCCHPRLVFPDAPMEASKLQAFLELAEELRENGHRALVFSQFVDFLELVREQLDERRIAYQYLDGSTPKEMRTSQVKAFQSGRSELFLISLKAGGFGLNLTRADYVIHLDPWWNPAVEAQATDRAHRIGQDRPVTVYRLVTKDSIEERIVELHEEKRAIADALLDGADVPEMLSSEELIGLLQLD